MKAFKPRISIGTKLIVSLIVILVLGLGGHSVVSIWLQQKELFREIHRGARQVNETILVSLDKAMMDRNPQEVRQALANIEKQARVEKIRIINHQGIVAVASPTEDEGRKVCEFTSPCGQCHHAVGDTFDTVCGEFITPCKECHPKEKNAESELLWRFMEVKRGTEGRVLHLSTPIINTRRCSGTACHDIPTRQPFLGILNVEMDLRESDRRIAAAKRLHYLFSAFILISVIILSWLVLRRLVTLPARTLVNSMQRIARGDLKHRVAYESKDELGMLADSFNKMTEKLSKAQSHLIRAEKLSAIGKLAAGVAHEVNNPLTGILTFAEELRDKVGDDDQARRDCDVIIRETHRLRRIVGSLLDFTKTRPTERKELDVGEVIQWTVNILSRQKKSQSVDIISKIESELPPIMGDKGQIQQVFINLIANAIEAIEDKGTVWVSARVDNDGVGVEIKDTGAGIEQENLERIFEPFFTTKEGQSSGLGLSIIQSIIEQHDGSISVESEQGKGTTFMVWFPAKRTEID